MATVTYIRETKQSPSAMRGLMNYCCREDKVTDADGKKFCSGVNCDGENAFAEFMLTKKAYRKNDGMNFYQYVQSFSPEENISYDEAHAIALAFAARAWPGHEVLVTTHCDAPHVHSHFVINSVSFETGYKLRQHPNTLKELRQISDEICAAHGLSVLEPYEKDGVKLSAREYRVASRGESWKFQLMAVIEDAMKKIGSKREFLSEMHRHGYEVIWTAERRYITYCCPNGMKCRDKRLHDKKYEKENMEDEFHIRKQITEEFGGIIADAEKRRRSPGDPADRVSAHRVRHSQGTAGDGTAAADGRGGVPADTVPADRDAGDAGGTGGSADAVRKPAEPISDDYSGGDAECQREAVGIGSSDRLTGWESERSVYLRMLLGAGAESSTDRAYHRRYAAEDLMADGRHLPGSGGLVGLGLRGLLEAGSIIENNGEDPEERRKRIEAQQNGADLGAVIGLAAGLIIGAAETHSADETPTEEEQESPTMGGI